MSTEVKELWLSAADLAELSKRGLRMPGSVRGCRDMAKREKWPSKEVQGKGGKGGVLTIYRPPNTLLAAIAALDQVPQPTLYQNQTVGAVEQPSALPVYADAAKATDDLSPDWSMLEILLRVAEYKLKEPMTADLADKIERVVVAWMPVATGRPDLTARLDRLLTAVALLRPN